jgi:hypothetical protein
MLLITVRWALKGFAGPKFYCLPNGPCFDLYHEIWFMFIIQTPSLINLYIAFFVLTKNKFGTSK